MNYNCSNQIINFLKCTFHSKEILEDFPWRNLPKNKVSPWEVAIGEVLLNRVSATRVLPIYKELIENYPSPCELSKIEPKELEKILKSLGLQKKKTNLLIELSQMFCYEKEEEKIKKALKKTKGIGKSTYNAIMLFGFEEPVPLMDGVIGRVLGRIFNLKWKNKVVMDKSAWLLSNKLLSCIISKNLGNPKVFYYFLLDLGRNFCFRIRPKCEFCPCYKICSYTHNFA